MRTITIEIPASGIRLKLSAGQNATHRRAVLVLPDGVDAHLDADERQQATSALPAKAISTVPLPLSKENAGKPMSTQEIGARLIKLKVRSALHEKSLGEVLLCATSVSSVSLWLFLLRNI
jgi:hypothetical protein